MLPCGRVLKRAGSSKNVAARSQGSLRCSHNSTQARQKVIFSGIQPTGVPHLGNYLGALRTWVKLQNESDSNTSLIYSLVDLHAITIRQDPKQLRQWKKECLAMLLAIGLDPKRSTIFHQSDVAAHAELMWILSCQASTGYLSRMTQWKDKTANERENSEKLKLGLFSYPVLQAADVLLHRTTHVPVGQDQAQHLEFAREIANGFNHAFGQNEVLIPPETLISPAKRVMSLTDPTSKMSKSHANAKSRILLTDTSDIIKAKIKGAVTDSQDGISYDIEGRPGVSNLIDVLYHIKYENENVTLQELVKDLQGMSLRSLKETVTAAVEDLVQPIRDTYLQVVTDKELLTETAESGRQQASYNAEKTLSKVKRAIGLS